MLEQVRSEIEYFHAFLVEWFTGRAPDDAWKEPFGRFDRAFKLIPPAGNTLELATLEDSIRSGHGNNPDFAIQIRNTQIVWSSDEATLATYEEWQRNAKNSEPKDNARVGTVLFVKNADGTLKWRHLQETWLPKSVVSAGPFDF